MNPKLSTAKLALVGFLVCVGCGTVAVNPSKQLRSGSIRADAPPRVLVHAFVDARPNAGSLEIGAIKNYVLFNMKQFRYESTASPSDIMAQAFARGLNDRGIPAIIDSKGQLPLELTGQVEEFACEVVMRYGVRIKGHARLLDTRTEPPSVLATASFAQEKFRGPGMTSARGSGAIMEELFAEVIPQAVTSVLDDPSVRAALQAAL